MFVLHLICVIYLVKLMKKTRDLSSSNQEAKKILNHEIAKLYVILGFFNTSFLIRSLYDFLAKPNKDPEPYVLIITLFLGILWDIAPVSLLMGFHYYNFRASNLRDSIIYRSESTQRNSSVYTKANFTLGNESEED